MLSKENNDFVVYVLKYLGIALIAGSIVHVGTLDVGTTRYIILASIGLVLMTVGNILESRQKGERINIKYLVLITSLSLTTGFLSGGIQHYLDNPLYAGYLLGIGLIGTFITFFIKEKSALKTKNIILISGISIAIVLISVFLVPSSGNDHHGEVIEKTTIIDTTDSATPTHSDVGKPPHAH
jgi:phosphoglycerol transferase MdoB-like AlkP superfamily enzyme